MSVPDRKAIMRPALAALADGEIHSSVEIRDLVARHFGLSEIDRAQPAGNSPFDRFTNEHAFALVDLQRLKLVTKPDRRQFAYRITAQGKRELRGVGLPAEDSVFAEEAAGSATAPTGQNGSRPFQLGGKTYRSIPDLAARDPHAFARLSSAALLQENAAMTAREAAARMAHRTRILIEAGGSPHTRGTQREAVSAQAEPASDPRRPETNGTEGSRSGWRQTRRRTVIRGAGPRLEGYDYWRREARVAAEQREFELVSRFCTFLAAAGYEYRQEQLSVGDGWITYDLFDASRRILFEAKADALSRGQVRMAIGQLLDYGYHGFENPGPRVNKAVLLPASPADDVAELLAYLDLGIAYETVAGDFVEDYPWA